MRIKEKEIKMMEAFVKELFPNKVLFVPEYPTTEGRIIGCKPHLCLCPGELCGYEVKISAELTILESGRIYKRFVRLAKCQTPFEAEEGGAALMASVYTALSRFIPAILRSSR